MLFQPTRPCGARRYRVSINLTKVMFQPTRPCGARLKFSVNFNPFLSVSTHAPVRGATGIGVIGLAHQFVSTHAPVRGATGVGVIGLAHQFVSTHAPVRGATQRHGQRWWLHRVSTHAPVRGATNGPVTCDIDPSCFNPRARAGRDYFRSRRMPVQ